MALPGASQEIGDPRRCLFLSARFALAQRELSLNRGDYVLCEVILEFE